MNLLEKVEKEHVLRLWKTRTTVTTASTRSTDSTSRRWTEMRLVKGSRLPVDVGMRADRGCRHPPRLTTKTSTWWMEMARTTANWVVSRIDSEAAESVIPPDMLQEVPTRPSPGSRAGAHYIAANGGRMPNLGEKHVKFRTERVPAQASSSR